MTLERTESRNPFLGLYEERESALLGSGPDWLAPLRRAAIARVAERGLPTRKDESFRYSDMRALLGLRCVSAEPDRDVDSGAVAPHLFELGGPTLVLVDGHYRADLSRLDDLPAGLTVQSLATALVGEPGIAEEFARWTARPHELHQPEHAFTELNSALFEDGLYVKLADGVVLEKPIQVLHFTSSGVAERASHVRHLVVAGRAAQGSLVEVHAGGGAFKSTVTDAHLGPGAIFDHHKIQNEEDAGHHVAKLRVTQERDSRFGTYYFAFGAASARHEVEVRHLGEGCHCDLDGMYVLDGHRHADNYTTVHHAVPHCTSREVYKGIVSDGAEGVFSGKIYVHVDAQKTDAYQQNDGLLLSDDASVNTRPNLEIYADNVRCSHGATIGQLDLGALFYLRSRGIAEHHARQMLVRAFAHEVIDRVPVEVLRDRLDALLVETLALEGEPA